MKHFNKVHFIIWILLFSYMFTYYGDHNLGDTARIPLGYNRDIKQIDTTTTIRTKQKTYFVYKFYKQDHLLFIQTQPDPFTKKVNEHLVWNLKTNEYKTFKSQETLSSTYPINFDLNQFKTFNKNYHEYWGGWKFWLLP